MKRRRREAGQGPVQPGEPGIAEAYGPEVTVVGRGARVEGSLVSSESIRIDGRAKGRISARADVILSSQSHVEANIQAENVVMGGTLKGDVTARTKTELAEGGRVEGNIRSKVLVVNEGATFSGQANTDLGDAPRDVFPEDELQTAYDEAARRAADRYKSVLSRLAELDHQPVQEPDPFPARSGR
jgi:cytoskeletal protein CcmA (bactofilin family)